MKALIPIATKEDADRARAMVWHGTEPVFCTMHRVSVHRLHATQDDLSPLHFGEILQVLKGHHSGASNIGAIEVAELGRRLIVVDGHHRASAALRLGWKHVWASVRRPAAPSRGTEK